MADDGKTRILLYNGLEVMRGQEWELTCWIKEKHGFCGGYSFRHLGYEIRTFREHIIEEVRAELSNEKWYNGVCCDSIAAFNENWNKVDEAIEEAKKDTVFWGAPNCGLGM